MHGNDPESMMARSLGKSKNSLECICIVGFETNDVKFIHLQRILNRWLYFESVLLWDFKLISIFNFYTSLNQNPSTKMQP